MDNLPKISVITPVKNGGKTLERAIKSLIDQHYPNLEYIVIDGVSTDNTLDIIKKYQDQITYWESKSDSGSQAAYSDGIAKSTGDLVVMLNADDFFESGILQKIGEEFKKDPSVDIISSRFRFVKMIDGKEQVIYESPREELELSRDKMFISPAPNARFFKRELYLKYGFPMAKDDQGRNFVSNDLEHLIRLVLKGVKNTIIDDFGYNYLVHEDSLTFSSSLKTKRRLFEDKIFIAKKFLKEKKEFDLPKSYEKNLIKWIKKYRAKLIMIDLKERNFSELKKNFAEGIKDNGLMFVIFVIRTSIRNKDL